MSRKSLIFILMCSKFFQGCTQSNVTDVFDLVVTEAN